MLGSLERVVAPALAVLLPFAVAPAASAQVDGGQEASTEESAQEREQPAPDTQPDGQRPSHTITRIPARMTRPKIDGVLDEPVWQEAVPLTGLRQRKPVQNGEPSERTDVLLLYDDAGIFIGVFCHDSEPDQIRATVRERDANLSSDDVISLLFDPLVTRINGFAFQIGAGGARSDGAVSGGRLIPSVDYNWFGQARITSEGWVAEIEIPWNQFNFDPEQTSWGFNFERRIARRVEEICWAFPLPRARFAQPSYAGDLDGLEDVQKGLSLQLQPFVVGRSTVDRSEGEENTDFDAGLDLFYKITPNAKLSLTANTDFAETEVDDRLINLTRFPLFLPERRPFFLEDSGNFTFGPPIRGIGFGRRRQRPPDIDLIPYFSRRIGLSPTGQRVPINYAGKLTGETESYNYGLLAVQTGELETLEPQDLAVASFHKKLWEQSDIGVIWTHGDPSDQGRNYTAGVDFNYRTTTFRDDENLNVSAAALQTSTDGISNDENAYQLTASYPNDTVVLYSAYTIIEENFDPAIGFVPRVGIQKWVNSFAYRPRPHTAIRQYDFRVEPKLVTNTDGETESVFVLYRPFGVELESGDFFRIDVEQAKEVLDQPFQIVPGVTIPAGSYEFLRAGTAVETSNKRPLEAFASVFAGEFYDGQSEEYKAGLIWRAPGAISQLGLEYEFDDVRLPAGDFTVSLARLRLDFQFGEQLTWSNFAQWDDASELLALNSRLRWFFEDGRELNFVVNQGWNYDTRSITTEDSELILKISYSIWL